MKFINSRSSEKKPGSLQQSLANERGEGSLVIADSRLESVNQQRLKGVIQNASVIQEKNMENLAGHPIQKTVGEEEELMQGKTLQRQAPEEEELMQGKMELHTSQPSPDRTSSQSGTKG